MRGGMLVLIFALGCGDRYHIQRHTIAPKDRGTRADIKTQPGSYDGYEVFGPCPEKRPPDGHRELLGVRGHGEKRVAIDWRVGWEDDAIALRERAEKALGDVSPMVWYGSGCDDVGPREQRHALSVAVLDFRHVDEAVRRIGVFLRDQGRGDEAVVYLRWDPYDDSREHDWDAWVPTARPPFFPWEAAILAGARRAGDWDAAFALHLGYIRGRGRRRTHDGAFVGVGVDGRVVTDAETEWSAGPILRAGWAFGPFGGPDELSTGETNRYTYAYVQAGPSWGGDSRFVASAGFTAFPLSIAVTWESAGAVSILIGPSL